MEKIKRYQRYFWPAGIYILILVLGGCRSSRVKFPKHGDSGPTFEVILDESFGKQRKKIIKESHEWLGTPYKTAHAEKGYLTDCSGMVMSIYLEAAGIMLPRNSAKQAEYCKRISKSKIKPGDLVFFATNKDKKENINHVGIMIDDSRFIHASYSKGVCISDLSQNYYAQRFKMFGRVPDLP